MAPTAEPNCSSKNLGWIIDRDARVRSSDSFIKTQDCFRKIQDVVKETQDLVRETWNLLRKTQYLVTMTQDLVRPSHPHPGERIFFSEPGNENCYTIGFTSNVKAFVQ